MSGIARGVKGLVNQSMHAVGLGKKKKKSGPIRPLTSDEVGAVGRSMGESMTPSEAARRKRRGQPLITMLGGEEESL